MTILLILITLSVCLTALFRPWIGVLAYYLLAIMTPQSIWPWIFDGIRVSLFVAAATFLGCVLAVVSGRLSMRRLNNKFSIAILIIFCFVNMSHWFSPYKGHPLAAMMLDPGSVLSIFNKAIMFYFIAVLCIDTEKKLRWMCYTLLGAFIFLTWWANQIYFSGQMWLLNSNGRLSGPGGLYSDENTFAVVFVVGSAFVYFLAQSFKRVQFKYGLFAALPMLWHAIFLTGSRGALLSVGVVAIYAAIRSKSKWIGVGILCGFIFILLWQGRGLLDRTVNTANEETLANQEVIDPRILSWKMGGQLIVNYPLLGVGFNRFQQASVEYSNGFPYVAHNTFLQFAANSGLICGILYLLFFWWLFKVYLKKREDLNQRAGEFYTLSFDSIAGGLAGFFIAAIFLDLVVYEIFYCLLAMLVAWQNIYLSEGVSTEQGEDHAKA